MNKKELTNAVAAKTGLNKTESRKALDAVIEIIIGEMKRKGRVLSALAHFQSSRNQREKG